VYTIGVAVLQHCSSDRERVVANYIEYFSWEERMGPVIPFPQQHKPLVKAEVVAAHLSCSEATVLRLARAGRIPSRKISNGCRCHWRFDLEDVLNATRNGTTA
jgi:hypothetical protein